MKKVWGILGPSADGIGTNMLQKNSNFLDLLLTHIQIGFWQKKYHKH